MHRYSANKALLLTLGFLVAVGVAGCGGVTTTAPTEATSATGTTTKGTTAAPSTSATAAPPDGTTTSASTVTPGTAATLLEGWREVLSISGSDNANSEVFQLTGKAVRLTFSLEGDMAIGAVYLFEEGHDFDKEGGIPDVMLTGSGLESTDIVKEAGRYFLCVKAANCEWSAAVEEQE